MRPFLLLLFLFVSCKTREDIEREKLVSTLAVQMEDGQKLQSEATARLQTLEEQLSSLTGQVEEKSKAIGDSHSQRGALEEKVYHLEEEWGQMKAQLEQQSKYIQEVLSMLKGLSKKLKTPSAPTGSLYQKAMKNYKAKRYKTAKKQLLSLLEKKNLKEHQKSRILHNLGMICFMEKKRDDSLFYFGRLFTEHPKSSYNERGLLFMGKSFIHKKQWAKAKEALNELLARFPKSRQVPTAKKLLKAHWR